MALQTASLPDEIHKLFVALTVVKSKPKAWKLNVYLEEIRSSVHSEIEEQSRVQPAPEKRNAAHQRSERLNDIEHPSEELKYWKEQRIKVQGLVTSLEQKLAALEVLNVELNTKLHITLNTANAANSCRKRKQLEMVEAPSPNKAAKLSQHPQASQAVQTTRTPRINQATQTSRTSPPVLPAIGITLQDEARVQNILDVVELQVQSTEVEACLKSLCALQRSMTQDEPNQSELSSCITRSCLDICQIVHTVVDELSTEPAPVKGKTTSNPSSSDALARHAICQHQEVRLQLIIRSSAQVGNACGSLKMNDTCSSTHIQAVASVTWLFNRLLRAIHHVSSPTSAAASRRGAARRAKTCCKQGLVADGGPSSADGRDGDAKWLCSELSGLFVSVFSALQSFQSTDINLLEGPLYVLFSESGELLQRFMLADQENGNIGSKIAEMPQVLEAQSLAWILERVLTLMHQAQQPMASIAAPAVEKLQNTLLHAVFKTDQISLADRLYPAPKHSMERSQGLDESAKDVGPWFRGEIWRLIGKDIFARMKESNV